MTTWIVAALDSELSQLKAELHAQPFREIPGYSCSAVALAELGFISPRLE